MIKHKTSDATASHNALIEMTPLFIAWAASRHGFDEKLIDAADEVTDKAYARLYEEFGGTFHQGWSIDLDAAHDWWTNNPEATHKEWAAELNTWCWEE